MVRVFGPGVAEFAGGVIGLAVIFPPSKATDTLQGLGTLSGSMGTV